jgi:hypothetical protein
MTAANKMDWAKLLADAISEPGKISDAYRRFRGYSLSNRLWALCSAPGAELHPDPWPASIAGSNSAAP